MDEMDHNTKPRRTRVLRAADVIPPFDEDLSRTGENQADRKSPEPAVPETGSGDGCSTNVPEPAPEVTDATAQGAKPSSIDGDDIPKYDLAENILAEQRRVAARRRRAPSQALSEPAPAPLENDVMAPVSEPSPADLPELQRIVAEIVARDIERLCKRPNR